MQLIGQMLFKTNRLLKMKGSKVFVLVIRLKPNQCLGHRID